MQKLYITQKKNIKNYLVKIQNIRNYFNGSSTLNKIRMKKNYENNIKNRNNYMIKCNNINSNINEVTRKILNSFIQKFHTTKKHKALTSEQK